MPLAPVRYYDNKPVQPYYDSFHAKNVPVKLPVSIAYRAGQILAEKTGVNEVQAITMTGAPTGGTFTITFGGQTTDAIAYNATAAAMQTALLALSTISTNAVQTVTLGGTPTSGSFTLSFRGHETALIAYDATAATVQTALENLPNIGSGNVTVSGSAGGPYTITFSGIFAGVPIAALGYRDAMLPSTATVTVAVVTPGGGGKNISVTSQNSLWTLTEANGTDGGSFALAITIGGVTQRIAAQAWNVSAADLQTALRALSIVGSTGVTVALASQVYTLTFAPALGNVHVAVEEDITSDGGVYEGGIVVAPGTPAYIVTFQNRLGATNVAAMTTTDSLTGGSTPATVVATLTAGSAGDGLHYAYDDAQTDGRQIAKGILMFDATTDSLGRITQGTQTGGGFQGETLSDTPMWVMGAFHTDDLVGLTATAVGQLGRLIEGNIATGGVLVLI